VQIEIRFLLWIRFGTGKLQDSSVGWMLFQLRVLGTRQENVAFGVVRKVLYGAVREDSEQIVALVPANSGEYSTVKCRWGVANG
jgi:hypothetical protein